MLFILVDKKQQFVWTFSYTILSKKPTNIKKKIIANVFLVNTKLYLCGILNRKQKWIDCNSKYFTLSEKKSYLKSVRPTDFVRKSLVTSFKSRRGTRVYCCLGPPSIHIRTFWFPCTSLTRGCRSKLYGVFRVTASILANSGYDVWLGDFRGNLYAKQHTRFNASDPEYWKFR